MSKVLIVDDEEDIRELLKNRFTANGFSTLDTDQGTQGLAMMENENPDIVILDISMQEMDGHTFVKEARRNQKIKDIPIMILTAKDKMQEIFRMERVNHYFLKPFDIDKLMAKAKEIVALDLNNK